VCLFTLRDNLRTTLFFGGEGAQLTCFFGGLGAPGGARTVSAAARRALQVAATWGRTAALARPLRHAVSFSAQRAFTGLCRIAPKRN